MRALSPFTRQADLSCQRRGRYRLYIRLYSLGILFRVADSYPIERRVKSYQDDKAEVGMLKSFNLPLVM